MSDTLLCLLALCALLPAQDGGQGPAKVAAIPAAAKNKLTALLPGPPGFYGKAEAPAKFYSTDLSRYIGERADAYLDYGLVALIHREFKLSSVDLTVDIYDMGDPVRAFGIYAAERSPDDLFIQMGAEGHVDIGSLTFLQGNYYVKLQALGDNDNTPTVLESAAKNIVSRIGPEGTAPQPVAWFPAEGQVARSMKYVVKAPMGYDYLSPATTVLYRFEGEDTTVLASLAPTPGEAASRLARLKEHFAGSGTVTAVAGLPGEVWRSGNQKEGDVVCFARGRYVVMVQAPPTPPDAFLHELYSSVKD